MFYAQSFYLSVGNYGCYALQLVNLARTYTGEPLDDTTALLTGIHAGYLTFDFANYSNQEAFYVQDPCGFLKLLTGKSWTVRKTSASYKLKEGEYAINFYAKSKADADKGIGHFDVETYHTLQNSQTIAKGKIYSKRVFEN